MPEGFDCYVMAPDRSARLARRFLDSFVPGALTPAFDELDPIDQLGPEAGTTLTSWLEFLETHSSVAYAMYWHAEHGEVLTATLDFTDDGELILGITTLASLGIQTARAASSDLLEKQTEAATPNRLPRCVDALKVLAVGNR
jgi:hypothetical protein